MTITRATEDTVADTMIAVLVPECSVERMYMYFYLSGSYTSDNVSQVPDVDKPVTSAPDIPVVGAALRATLYTITRFSFYILTVRR